MDRRVLFFIFISLVLALDVHSFNLTANWADNSTWNKTDPNNRFSVNGTHMLTTAMPNNENAWYYKDFGSAAIYNFSIRFPWIATTMGTDGKYIIGFTDEIISNYYTSVYTNKVDAIAMYVYKTSSGYNWAAISGANGTNWVQGPNTDIRPFVSTQYYVEMNRTGTTCTLTFFKDSLYLERNGTQSMTCPTNVPFRYFFTSASWNDAQTRAWTANVGNVYDALDADVTPPDITYKPLNTSVNSFVNSLNFTLSKAGGNVSISAWNSSNPVNVTWVYTGGDSTRFNFTSYRSASGNVTNYDNFDRAVLANNWFGNKGGGITISGNQLALGGTNDDQGYWNLTDNQTGKTVVGYHSSWWASTGSKRMKVVSSLYPQANGTTFNDKEGLTVLRGPIVVNTNDVCFIVNNASNTETVRDCIGNYLAVNANFTLDWTVWNTTSYQVFITINGAKVWNYTNLTTKQLPRFWNTFGVYQWDTATGNFLTDNVTVRIDTTELTATNLSAGTYYYNVSAWDSAGNNNTGNFYTFDVDTSPPNINYSPLNKSVNSFVNSLNFTLSKNGGNVSISAWNSSNPVNVTWVYTGGDSTRFNFTAYENINANSTLWMGNKTGTNTDASAGNFVMRGLLNTNGTNDTSTQIRVLFHSHTAAATGMQTLDYVYIGQVGTGNNLLIVTNPKNLTFNGGEKNFTIGQNAQIWSDYITYNFIRGVNYSITLRYSANGNINGPAVSAGTYAYGTNTNPATRLEDLDWTGDGTSSYTNTYTGVWEVQSGSPLPINLSSGTYYYNVSAWDSSGNNNTGNFYTFDVESSVFAIEDPYPKNLSVFITSAVGYMNVNYNITINNTNQANCSLYINNVFNDTKSYSGGTNTFVNFTKSMNRGSYNYSMFCYETSDLTTNDTTDTYYFYVFNQSDILSIPRVMVPNETVNYSNVIRITYTNVTTESIISTLIGFNITLLNDDLSVNSTIIESNDLYLNYTWVTSLEGDFYVRVRANDNNSFYTENISNLFHLNFDPNFNATYINFPYYVGYPVTINVTGVDEEGGWLTYFITWLKNGLAIITDWVYVVSGTTWNFILQPGNFTAGDNISAIITVQDDFVNATTKTLENTTILNYTVSYLNISPVYPSTRTQLDCMFNVTYGNGSAFVDLTWYNSTDNITWTRDRRADARFIVGSYSSCYQESTNTTNQGGLDGSCGLVYDGDYVLDLADWGTGKIIMNYTKPSGALANSKWQVKYGTTNGVNLTLPATCFNYYEDSLLLYATSSYDWSGADLVGTLDIGCYNGSWSSLYSYTDPTFTEVGVSAVDVSVAFDGDWSTRQTRWRGDAASWVYFAPGTSGFVFYEDAMWWNVTTSYENISSQLITTDIGNGSLPASYLYNNTYWKCNISFNENMDLSAMSASRAIYPIYNLTISAPTETKCYQETATTATSCGGLSTGSYNDTGNWNDGNWGTFSPQNNVWLVNYTIPKVSSSNNTFMYKDDFNEFNKTIPYACIFNGTKLQIQINNTGALNITCIDHSTNSWAWIESKNPNLGWFYEEAIWWNTYFVSNEELNTTFTVYNGFNESNCSLNINSSVFVTEPPVLFDLRENFNSETPMIAWGTPEGCARDINLSRAVSPIEGLASAYGTGTLVDYSCSEPIAWWGMINDTNRTWSVMARLNITTFSTSVVDGQTVGVDARGGLRFGQFGTGMNQFKCSDDAGDTLLMSGMMTNFVYLAKITYYGDANETGSHYNVSIYNDKSKRLIGSCDRPQQQSGVKSPERGITVYDGIYKLDNLCTFNGTGINASTTSAFNDTIYDECINPTVGSAFSVIAPNATDSNLHTTGIVEGDYMWNISCISINGDTLQGDNKFFRFDSIGPNFTTNLTSGNTSVFPQIGDTVYINATINDVSVIDFCLLQINDTGVFLNVSNQTYGTVGPINISLPYTIPYYDNRSNPNVSFRLWCNDSGGNEAYSPTSMFRVQDITFPTISIGTNNFFALNNLTILAPSQRFNRTFNVTFFDYNLFAIDLNVTCDLNGTQMNYSESGIVDRNVTVYNNVSFVGLPIQRCYATIRSADDHTNEKVEEYKSKKIEKGLEFITPEAGTKIVIEAAEEDLKSIETEKKSDRTKFGFHYDETSFVREYIVKANNDPNIVIYPRYDSKYPGHFVIWNQAEFDGNWIDTNADNRYDLAYKISELENGDWKVTVAVDLNKYLSGRVGTDVDKILLDNKDIVTSNKLNIPKKKEWLLIGRELSVEEQLLEKYGIKDITFSSIGGVLITNETYMFYLGGEINTTGFNLYSNTTFNYTQYNITITNVTALDYPTGIDLRFNENGSTISPLLNGTYQINFTSATYFNWSNSSLYVAQQDMMVNYTSCQSYVNLRARSIATGALLTNFNGSVINTANLFTVQDNTTTDTLTFCINATTYNYSIRHLAGNASGTFSTAYLENKTIDVYLTVYAQFILYDEYTLGPFNISSPSRTTFLMFCPNETVYINITSNLTTIPIACEYTSFQFNLEWTTLYNYYRSFILRPDELAQVKVYLIDAPINSYVTNQIIIDDILGDYVNPSIWIKKQITNETIQITADYVDIQRSIQATLLLNNKYIIEVHSTNKPIRVLGTYVASADGPKSVRLDDPTLGMDPKGFWTNTFWDASMYNHSNSSINLSIAGAWYEDKDGTTSSVTWNLWNGTPNIVGSTILFTSTTNINTSVIFEEYNVSSVDDIFSEIVPARTDGITVRLIKQIGFSDGEITNPLLQYIDDDPDVAQTWMNWFIILVLGTMALMATARTANMTGIVLILMAALLTGFGWLEFSMATLGVAIIVSIVAALVDHSKKV